MFWIGFEAMISHQESRKKQFSHSKQTILRVPRGGGENVIKQFHFDLQKDLSHLSGLLMVLNLERPGTLKKKRLFFFPSFIISDRNGNMPRCHKGKCQKQH